jgi:tellurite resistance protein TehA-like permease
VIFWYALAAALVVWALGLRPLLAGTAPPPLRPLQAIHLAPPRFWGAAAHLLGQRCSATRSRSSPPRFSFSSWPVRAG